MKSFLSLGLEEKVLNGIRKLGFETPTIIQEKAIPVLLSEPRDFIGLAQTGTGKTAAFGLPILQLLDFNVPHTQALVIAPTRELCIQISKDIKNFSAGIGKVNVVPVYGGASISTQISQLKRGAQIIVATPGRLIDLIGRKAIKLKDVDIVVLDEADEMLNMGFEEDINKILATTPDTRSTWLFSATMPKEVREISKNYMVNPYELTIGTKNSGASNIEHIYYVVHARDRYLALKRIVDINPDIYGIVFCRTRMTTQDVAEKLGKDGYNADSLHGDLSQQQRDRVMGRFRDRSLKLLVATDVAARGIDVSDITHVINYELPDDTEIYTHRTGRTGRAGKSGVAISITHMKETGKIRQLEKFVDKKFRLDKVPGGYAICEKQLFSLIEKVHNVPVNEAAIGTYLPRINEELEALSKEEIIKRFASIEFNRFLDYYMNAPDINVDVTASKGGSSKFGKMRQSNFQRMFINLGSADGFDAGRMLRFICDKSDIKGQAIGRIDIKGVYSFIDVDTKSADAVVNSLNGDNYRGRDVRADYSTEGRGRGSKDGRSGGGGGNKPYKKYAKNDDQRKHASSGKRKSKRY
jgi:ATP-dependent RNA helicase DeaD